MDFDFDTPVERRTSDSVKWRRYADRDILPLWVADADFRSPPAVVEAVRRRAEHGVFGYGGPSPELAAAVVETCKQEWGWPVAPAWLVWLPGLVTGLNVACRAVGGRGDAVASYTPVYPPFLKSPALQERELVTIPLSGDNQAGWGIERGRLERGLAQNARLLLWCHPHNPVGRAWRREELQAVAEACLARRIIICSDEIHAQLVLEPGVRHVPMAALGPEVAAHTITLLAPSKAFNVAGLGCAVAVIPDDDLRRRFKRAMAGIVPEVNVMGFAAAEAAWTHGGAWLAAQNTYLRQNRDLLARRVGALPGVTMPQVEATYLAWLDVRALGLADPAAHFEDHGLGLSDG
ncbi:MAG: putative C-S lyase, partial [Krumholzibacteria bacterium]|nr:putative C-S lyase [Candidatus Krumholzibacteria bacterium]